MNNIIMDSTSFLQPVIQASNSSEYKTKQKIIKEFEKLKSNKPGHINTISIDHAIDIVNKA